MIKYSKDHQWIKINDNGTAFMGITRYAADELGEVSFIELPETGACSQNQQICVVESTKAASDVFMPAACTITVVNKGLETDPSPLNDDPEGEGWIAQIENPDMNQVNALMDQVQYAEFCK